MCGLGLRTRHEELSVTTVGGILIGIRGATLFRKLHNLVDERFTDLNHPVGDCGQRVCCSLPRNLTPFGPLGFSKCYLVEEPRDSCCSHMHAVRNASSSCKELQN